MTKIVLNTVANADRLATINENFEKIEAALNEKVLYRDNPAGTPNALGSSLDVNGKRIYNLPEPSLLSEAARLQDVVNATSGNSSANLISYSPSNGQAANTVQSAILEAWNRTVDLFSAAGSSFIGFLHASANAIVRSVQSKLSDVINVRDFGAVGDGVSNDTTAIQNAILFAESVVVSRGAIVEFPKGIFKTTAPIVISQRGITIRGQGNVGEGATIAGGTQVIADHNIGAVFRISVADTVFEKITIGSSDARYGGSAGTTAAPCAGLHFEGPDVDTGAAALQRTRLRDVTVIKQPSHGILHVSACESSSHESVFSQYNKGHGIVFDRGILTGRTYSRPPGIVTMSNIRVQDNGGHGLAIGNPADTDLPAYRVVVTNMESIRNASDTSVRYEEYGTFAYGQNLNFNYCAFGARPTGATIGAPWTGGLALAGRCIRVNGCRYINNDQPARVFEYAAAGEPTRDIEFDGMHISSDGRTPFANAVVVDAGVEQVRVKVYADARSTNAQYTRPVNIDFEGFWSEESAGLNADAKIIARDFSSSPLITLQDDTVQTLTFSGNCGGVLMVVQQNDANCAAMVAFRVGDSSHYITPMFAGSSVVTGTGILGDNAVDGTNARFNIFVADDGTRRIFLKNRMAGERQFRIVLLGVTSPRIMLTTAF